MNERLSMQDFVELLAAKHGMSKKEAEGFVKEFFLLIEQALESDRCVKIKGFGTFKLVDVDSRESVNVNTGERFEIQSHTKISFAPDAALRNTINKPFEHFETVILNENTVLEDTLVEEPEEESDETVELTDNLEVENPAKADEPVVAVVIEELLKPEAGVMADESPDDMVVDTPEETAVSETSEVTEVPEVIEVIETPETPEIEVAEVTEAPETEEMEQSSAETPKVEDAVPQLSAEDIIAAELRKADREFKSVVIEPEKTPDYSGQLPPTKPVSEKKRKEKSATPYLVTIIVLVLLLCSSALLFVYYPDLFSGANTKEVVQAPVPQPVIKQEIVPDTLTVVKDTVAEVAQQSKEIVPEEIRKKTPDQEATITTKTSGKTAMPVKPDSVNYKILGTKATYTIKEGETLTRVSLRFYGTKDLWPYIVQHNRDVIKNPDNVPYGTTLKIPELVKR